MSANDQQVAGSHYAGSYQHWDFAVSGLDNRYLEGQITKYVYRWRQKNGLEDLQKAQHFLQKLREEHTAGRVAPVTEGRSTPAIVALVQRVKRGESLQKFMASNELGASETQVMVLLSDWSSDLQLAECAAAIEALIQEAIDAAASPAV